MHQKSRTFKMLAKQCSIDRVHWCCSSRLRINVWRTMHFFRVVLFLVWGHVWTVLRIDLNGRGLLQSRDAEAFGLNDWWGKLRLQTVAWLLDVGLRLPPADPLLPGINSVLALQFWDFWNRGDLFEGPSLWRRLRGFWLLRLAALLWHVSSYFRKTCDAERFGSQCLWARDPPPGWLQITSLHVAVRSGSTESGMSWSNHLFLSGFPWSLSPFWSRGLLGSDTRLGHFSGGV